MKDGKKYKPKRDVFVWFFLCWHFMWDERLVENLPVVHASQSSICLKTRKYFFLRVNFCLCWKEEEKSLLSTQKFMSFQQNSSTKFPVLCTWDKFFLYQWAMEIALVLKACDKHDGQAARAQRNGEREEWKEDEEVVCVTR